MWNNSCSKTSWPNQGHPERVTRNRWRVYRWENLGSFLEFFPISIKGYSRTPVSYPTGFPLVAIGGNLKIRSRQPNTHYSVLIVEWILHLFVRSGIVNTQFLQWQRKEHSLFGQKHVESPSLPVTSMNVHWPSIFLLANLFNEACKAKILAIIVHLVRCSVRLC